MAVKKAPMMPTADAVAVAVVAACKAIGEDPIETADGSGKHCRARHYAMHALKHVFPDCSGSSLARMTGYVVDQYAGSYFSHSLRKIVHGKGHWWNAQVYAEVIAAVEARFGSALFDLPSAPEPGPPISAPVFHPITPEVMRAVFDPPPAPKPPAPVAKPSPTTYRPTGTLDPGKLRLYDELHRAVQNTAAKMPKGD